MFAVIGPISLVAASVKSATSVKKELTAAYLLQEALESARNIRDNKKLLGGPETGNDWLGTLVTACYPNKTCRVEINHGSAPTVSTCTDGACVLRYEASTGRYGYNVNWVTSIYTRTLEVMPYTTTVGANTYKYAEIKATVSWPETNASNMRIIKATTTLYNW